MPVGTRTSPVSARSVLADARAHSGRMGDLVAQARRIAGSVMAGRHGRRRQGTGEDFWQFRPYVAGEATTQIDWRRSARDNHTYVRDREWDVAQTVFLCPDTSASMLYQSQAGQHSKEMRAIMLTLILAEILARSGEQIAIPGILAPARTADGAGRAALALGNGGEKTGAMDFSRISRHAAAIIISDFLNPVEETAGTLSTLAERHVRAHLVEVADPAEALFPFSGHITFLDPEDGRTFSAGRAQGYRDSYCRLYAARRDELAAACRRYGWSFCVSMTDRPLSETLSFLNTAIRADRSHGRSKA